MPQDYYLNENAGETIVKEDKVYINKTGIKIDSKYEYQSTEVYQVEYVSQWDTECKILSSKSIVTKESVYYVRYFTFTY